VSGEDHTVELFSAMAATLAVTAVTSMIGTADDLDSLAVNATPLDALFYRLTAARIRWLACALCGVNPR
jgi:hypothetical protein